MALPNEQKLAIRQKLLEGLNAQNTPQVRNKVGDAVAEIARQYSEESMCSPSIAHA
jgi:hypothetical protein